MKETIRSFPNLENFVIRECPKIMGELPKCLQSLVELKVLRCPKLGCELPGLEYLKELNLEECDEGMLRSGAEVDLRSLASLQLNKILNLNFLRTRQLQKRRSSLVGLQELVTKGYDGLACMW